MRFFIQRREGFGVSQKCIKQPAAAWRLALGDRRQIAVIAGRDRRDEVKLLTCARNEHIETSAAPDSAEWAESLEKPTLTVRPVSRPIAARPTACTGCSPMETAIPGGVAHRGQHAPCHPTGRRGSACRGLAASAAQASSIASRRPAYHCAARALAPALAPSIAQRGARQRLGQGTLGRRAFAVVAFISSDTSEYGMGGAPIPTRHSSCSAPS